MPGSVGCCRALVIIGAVVVTLGLTSCGRASSPKSEQPTPVATPTDRPAPTPATPSAERSPSDSLPENGVEAEAEMVLVPSGEFTMGASPAGQETVLQFGWSDDWLPSIRRLVDGAGPPHDVYLDGFYIDKYEVTNTQYEAFVDATGYSPPASAGVARLTDPSQPVVGVSWRDANTFCGWAGKRLLTEAEWEKAARGPDGLTYPWGESWDPGRLRSADGIANRTLDDFDDWSLWQRGFSGIGPVRVGSYPGGASPYGVMDLAGNVWEWVADWFGPTYYRESPEQSPLGPPTGSRRVLRGGAWDVPRVAAFTWFREDFLPPEGKSTVVGFRCASSTLSGDQNGRGADGY